MTPPAPKGDGPPDAHRARAAAAPLVDPDALPPWTFRPVGVVRSPWRYVHDAPRQGRGGDDTQAEIHLRRGLQNTLKDLAGFERIWVVSVLSYVRGWRQQVVPPRDTTRRGIFATRAPHRPNPIGLTAARIVAVRGRVVTIAEHDLLDGTPVLDLKPYLPYCDAHPGARAGWTETVAPDAPDHRWS
jgi:tRNA-Thr(GGU) m(6)t(6)A37 methyltransferase TsaA